MHIARALFHFTIVLIVGAWLAFVVVWWVYRENGNRPIDFDHAPLVAQVAIAIFALLSWGAILALGLTVIAFLLAALAGLGRQAPAVMPDRSEQWEHVDRFPPAPAPARAPVGQMWRVEEQVVS